MEAREALGDLAEEERLRADLYSFLARTLLDAPDAAALTQISRLRGDESDLGLAFRDLATRAATSDPASVREEYEALFIGLGRGELVPFGSYYLTGFLNEKPLAKLRSEMAALGIARRDGVAEPEDHAGTLLEIMAGLIDGRYGQPASFEAQRSVFETHLAPWMGHFFGDLERADSAHLYAPLGRIGRLFVEIEAAAFAME